MNGQKRKTMCCILGICGLLAGCTPQVTTNVPNVLRVELDDIAEAEERQTVTVESSETVRVVPDMAKILYEIVTEDADAQKCQDKNRETLDAVLAYLKEQGVEERSLKTSDFSLNPQYDWSGSRQTLVGYEMNTELTVSDVPVEQVGVLLTGAVSAGANRIRSVSYYSSTYDEAYGEALALAMEAAKKKAETLAHAGGCQVTDVLSVTEFSDNQSGRYVDSGLSRANSNMLNSAESAPMEVMAGEMEIKASIEVVYRLLPQ